MHITPPSGRTGALEAAMQDGAWHREEGAQSVSDWHASVLLIGSQGLQPHLPPSRPGGCGAMADGAGSGTAEKAGRGRTVVADSSGAGGLPGGTLIVAAGWELLGEEAQAYTAPSAIRAATRRRLFMVWL